MRYRLVILISVLALLPATMAAATDNGVPAYFPDQTTIAEPDLVNVPPPRSIVLRDNHFDRTICNYYTRKLDNYCGTFEYASYDFGGYFTYKRGPGFVTPFGNTPIGYPYPRWAIRDAAECPPPPGGKCGSGY